MKLIVTGSIAFDYLMSVPGQVHRALPAGAHASRVAQFLVDSMDKRRGGCGPNIAYTHRVARRAPYLMATAGQDFSDYKAWMDAVNIDTSLVKVSRRQVLRLVLLQHRPGQQPDRVVLHRRDGQCRRAVDAHGRGIKDALVIIAPTIPTACAVGRRNARRWASSTSGIPASSARAWKARS
jgi:hypothetical protein